MRDIYEEKRFSLRGYGLLFALPLFNFVTAQAFPWVRLHYTDIEYFRSGSIANCQGYAGIGNYVSIVYNLFLVFLSIGRIIKHLNTKSRQQRQQNLSLLAAILIPLVVNMYHSLSYNHLRLDLNPIAVSISMVLLLRSVQKQDLLNIAPLARARAVELMSDAFIVYSQDYTFLDANKSAKRLFPELDALRPGDSMEFITKIAGEDQISMSANGELRYFAVVKDSVLNNGRISGVSMVLRDITDKENQLQGLYGKATFDPLMSIYNRATFFELAQFLLSTEKAKRCPYAMLMIDIDNFKQFNDTYGHPCGDKVLQTLAEILKGRLRKNDIIGRYVGEEIVVLMEGITLERAAGVAESFCAAIEDAKIHYETSELRITASIGIAHSAVGSTHSLTELLVQADAAMYQAKNTGRNRVCLYEKKKAVSSK